MVYGYTKNKHQLRAGLRPHSKRNAAMEALLNGLIDSGDMVAPLGMPTKFLLSDAGLAAIQAAAGEDMIKPLRFGAKARAAAIMGLDEPERYTTLINYESIGKLVGDFRSTLNLSVRIAQRQAFGAQNER